MKRRTMFPPEPMGSREYCLAILVALAFFYLAAAAEGF